MHACLWDTGNQVISLDNSFTVSIDLANLFTVWYIFTPYVIKYGSVETGWYLINFQFDNNSLFSWTYHDFIFFSSISFNFPLHQRLYKHLGFCFSLITSEETNNYEKQWITVSPNEIEELIKLYINILYAPDIITCYRNMKCFRKELLFTERYAFFQIVMIWVKYYFFVSPVGKVGLFGTLGRLGQ